MKGKKKKKKFESQNQQIDAVRQTGTHEDEVKKKRGEAVSVSLFVHFFFVSFFTALGFSRAERIQ